VISSLDFTHVSDVIRALEVAGDKHLSGVYNVGTGGLYSFNGLAGVINEELGTAVDPTYVENPISESVYVHNTYADLSKHQTKTGWETQTSFKAELKRVCELYQ